MFEIPVLVKKVKNARHLKVRVCPYRRCIILTTPPSISKRSVEAFLVEHRVWIERKVETMKAPAPLFFDQKIPVFGEEKTLAHDPLRVARVFEEGDILFIGGRKKQSLDPFLIPYLIKKAHEYFEVHAQSYAQRLGVKIYRISIKETVSRWGSCSSKGVLSFNWRLALAPREVADYVCIHEVCHLREMNHSPQFWSLVEGLCPHYERHRQWLKHNGSSLYATIQSPKAFSM